MLSDVLLRRYREAYVIALAVGVVLFTVLLYVNGWNVYALTTSGTMLLLFAVSNITMRFLSGLGIMLTYASFCTFVFRSTSAAVKGDAKLARRVKTLLLLPIVAMVGYAVYKLIGVYFFSATLSYVEILVMLYGIWSLLIGIYVLPVMRGIYQPEYRESTSDKILHKLGDAKYSLWKGYQTKIHRDYGKVYAKEFERYREEMAGFRAQLSGALLIPLGLVTSVVPPLALVLVVLWLRSFTLDKKPLMPLERVLLLVIIVIVLLLSTAVVLTLQIASYLFLFDTIYGIGILASIIVLGTIILRS
jgi:hypothetical protein